MIIKSKAGTEIAKNGYTVIDELNQIPMIKTNYLQLEHNHINPIIIGSKAFEYKDIFVNVVEDTETSGDTAFKEYNAIHEFAWILSGMRKHDSYTGYLSLEQYLTMVLEGTEFTYQVEGGHQYYALQFENLGDGESHLDMFFKMLNRWDTEFELRGKKVYITHQRGRLRDKHVGRYKMNIIDTIINSDITDGATAVWGYFGKKDEENPENSTYREFYWQIDELVEQYGIRYAKPYSNENITQEETMIEYLNNILLDSWKISTEVDIAEITDEVVQTGDEYVAVDERLGITLNTRIQKLESVYDADDKLLYQTATLGTVSFASAASGSSSQLQEVIEKVKKDYNDRITDLKQEFDNRFNDEVTQIEIDFNKLVNGVRQEIQADKEAFELQYKADKEALSGEIQSSYTNAVAEANRIVEAKEVDFKNYADGIGNAANGRIDDLYGGLGDLSSEFENLEIGGRNYFSTTLNAYNTTGLYGYRKVSNDNTHKVVTIKDRDTSVDISGIYFGFTRTGYNASDGARWEIANGELLRNHDNDESLKTFNYLSFFPKSKETLDRLNKRFYIKVEHGNKATDWSPAPEDTDQKLTIIANDLDGVQTKVENNTGAITTVTQLATGTQQRVTDAEGNINTITNLANGTQQTVTNMLNGNATKGTVFQNTVDGFLNRAWQTDIDNLQIGGRNLLVNSDDLQEGSKASGITTSKVDDGIYKNVLKINNPTLASYITISANDYASYPTPNKDFTVSFLVKGKTGTGKIPNLTLYYNAESRYQEYSQEVSENEYRWISLRYNLKNTVPSNHIGVSNFSELYIARMKVEQGNKATDWSPAPEDLMKYTDIVARPDGFLIGSFEMGGDKIAQAIVGKAGAIDLIAQNVNFTGNVNVANQIKTYSLEAVYADIAKLRTNILTANSVEANALKVDTALINKLNTNGILTNYLIADTAMIENIKSKSLEAVYADISELRTRLLVADVITANMVKFDTALIEKFTSSTAFINSLTAKSAFISNVKAIDIDFNRAQALGSNGSSYLKIVSDKIELAGTYDRTWRGIRSTRQIKTELFDGGINFINSTDNRSLWYSDFGVSTFKDGDGEGTSSGTLAFFDTTHSSGGARGVTLVSNTGVVALETRTSAQNILLKSSGNVQVTTVGVLKVSQGAGDGYTESHLLMPRETTNLYAGFENEFRFTNRDFYNDGDTIYNRFRASIGFVHGLQNNASGAIPGTHLYLGSLAGEIQIVRDVTATNKVYGNARMSGLYVDELIPHSYSAIIMRAGIDVRGNILLPSNEQIRTSGGYLTLRAGSGHIFLQSGYEARVVSPGTTNSYMPIRASNFFEGSSEKFKDVIGIWNYDALSVIKDEVQLYSYTLKNNEGKSFNKINHSVIIERETPAEWITGDGVDIREVSMWGIRAIQQLAHENDTLKSEIAELKSQINKIMEMIA